MTRGLIKRESLASRLHFSQNTIKQFKKDRFHSSLVSGNAWKEFDFTIQPQRMPHILEVPGIFPVLLVGSDDIWRRRIRTERFKDGTRLTKGFGASAVYHHNKTQHAL